jgi:hypothetical protein
LDRDILCRAFPQDVIRTKPGPHGKTLSYIDVAAVIARLNEGCDSWSFEVVDHKILQDEVIVLGKLCTDGVTNMAFGGSRITLDKEGRAVSIGDELKAASSSALKKAATLIGVGLSYADAPEAAGNAQHRQRAPTPDERVTSKQLAAIQASCRRHNVGRDELGELIARSGKSALQFLTKREASEILSELDGRGNGAHPPFDPQ